MGNKTGLMRKTFRSHAEERGCPNSRKSNATVKYFLPTWDLMGRGSYWLIIGGGTSIISIQTLTAFHKYLKPEGVLSEQVIDLPRIVNYIRVQISIFPDHTCNSTNINKVLLLHCWQVFDYQDRNWLNYATSANNKSSTNKRAGKR